MGNKAICDWRNGQQGDRQTAKWAIRSAGWGDVPTDACAPRGAGTTGLDNMSLGMF